jgi:hypothetical protein
MRVAKERVAEKEKKKTKIVNDNKTTTKREIIMNFLQVRVDKE